MDHITQLTALQADLRNLQGVQMFLRITEAYGVECGFTASAGVSDSVIEKAGRSARWGGTILAKAGVSVDVKAAGTTIATDGPFELWCLFVASCQNHRLAPDSDLPTTLVVEEYAAAADLAIYQLLPRLSEVRVGVSAERPETVGEDGQKPSKSADRGHDKRKKTKPKATINARMLDVLTRKPECRGWKVTQWQAELKCSGGGIVATETWQLLKAARDLARAEHGTTKRRRSKPRRKN